MCPANVSSSPPVPLDSFLSILPSFLEEDNSQFRERAKFIELPKRMCLNLKVESVL